VKQTVGDDLNFYTALNVIIDVLILQYFSCSCLCVSLVSCIDEEYTLRHFNRFGNKYAYTV